MSDWLAWVSTGVVRGTFRIAGSALSGCFTAIEAIAKRKVGMYILSVAVIDDLSAYGGQQARLTILEMRQPTLEELHSKFPNENDPSNYRVISLNPKDYDGSFHGDLGR